MTEARETEDMEADAGEEIPAFFPAGDETLFGILTLPRGAVRTGVLIASGGLAGTSTVGRNQMFVRLNRRLSAEGLATMRFDYHGIGESTGVVEEFRLDAQQPFVTDIVGAARFFQTQGIGGLVLVGKCFGSRMALASTSSIERLQGVVLIGAPVRDFARRERTTTKLAAEYSAWDYLRRALRRSTLLALRDPRKRKSYLRVAKAKLMAMRRQVKDRGNPTAQTEPRWVSPGFIKPLEALAERDVPIQLIYGVEDEFYEEFERASKQHERLRRLVEHPLVQVTTVPGRVGDFVQPEVQEAMLDAVCGWIRQRNVLTPI